MMLQFGIYTSKKDVGDRLQGLLHTWADLMCLHLETVRWGTLEDLTGDAPGAGCAMIFLDAEGWGPKHRSLIGQVKCLYPETGLVLLSADPRFAIDSYLLHPDGFLNKPVVYSSLAKTLERCPRAWQSGRRWLEAPANRTTMRIPLCEILYAEASGRNCILHCNRGEVQLSRSLGWTETLLPSGPFLRCQKSFIVNLRAVRQFSGGAFSMDNGATIAVGRGHREEIQRQYKAYMRLTASEGV